MSINKREKIKIPGNGFGFRLAQAILYFIILLLFLFWTVVYGRSYTIFSIQYPSYYYNYYEPLFFIFLSFLIFFAIYTVVQIAVTFAGKKSIWANNLSIALGVILFCCVGFLGIIGGVKGRMYLQYSALRAQGSEEPEAESENESVCTEAALNDSAQDVQDNEYEEEMPTEYAITETEYTPPKMSQKGRKAMMITLAVSYSLLLLAGILLAAVPSLSSLISDIGICEEISARSYAITIGTMWVALVPSFGYFFATISPFEISKKTKFIIAAITTVLLVAMVAVFFLIIEFVTVDLSVYMPYLHLPLKEFFEGNDEWFIPVSMVFAAVGIMVGYLLTLFKINPEKIKDVQKRESGEGLFAALLNIFIGFIRIILKMIKAILKFKDKHPEIFIFIVTILLTWFVYFASFIVCIICIAFLVGVLVMCLGGFMHWSLAPSGQKKAYVFVNDMGCEQTIYSYDGKTFYDANEQYIGSSDDNGKHIYLNS